jgi:hypothetical protein
MEKITVTATSRQTSKVEEPIILSQGEREQTIFDPELLDNPNHPEQSVMGKLIITKTSKAFGGFDSPKITRSTIGAGQAVEIHFNHTQTYNLFQGLKKLYDFKAANHTRNGTRTYIEEDDQLIRLQELIKDGGKLVTLLEATSASDLDIISTALNVENLIRLKKQLDANINNDDESFWQEFFTENTAVLSLIFVAPIIFCGDKVYVGGKGMDNTGGKYPDFIYKNIKTKNAVLIEIKTPQTPLMENKLYREDTYSISKALAGSVSQVHMQGDTLVKTYRAQSGDASDKGIEIPYKVNHIESIIVIGNTSSLSEPQKRCFDLFRNDLRRVKIVTFDEIQEKINILLELLQGGSSQIEATDEIGYNIDEEELPF